MDVDGSSPRSTRSRLDIGTSNRFQFRFPILPMKAIVAAPSSNEPKQRAGAGAGQTSIASWSDSGSHARLVQRLCVLGRGIGRERRIGLYTCYQRRRREGLLFTPSTNSTTLGSTYCVYVGTRAGIVFKTGMLVILRLTLSRKQPAVK